MLVTKAMNANTIDRWDKSLEVTLDGIARAGRGEASNEYFLSSLMGNEVNCYEHLMDTVHKADVRL